MVETKTEGHKVPLPRIPATLSSVFFHPPHPSNTQCHLVSLCPPLLRSSAPPLLHCWQVWPSYQHLQEAKQTVLLQYACDPQLSRGNSSSSLGEIGFSVLLQEPHLRLLFQNQGFHAIQCNPSALNSIITDACACIGFARPTICKSYASHLQASLRRSALPFYPSTLPHRRRIF